MRAALTLLVGWLLFASSPAGAQQPSFLYIPPITGIASTPGFPGVLPIVTFGVSGHSAFIIRDVDATSPALQTAELNETRFAFADLLFYEVSAAQPQPSLDYRMDDVVISGYSLASEGVMPEEMLTISFRSAGYVIGVPEPSTAALMLVGLLVTAGLAVRRRS